MWTPHDARSHQGDPHEQYLEARAPSSSSLSLCQDCCSPPSWVPSSPAHPGGARACPFWLTFLDLTRVGAGSSTRSLAGRSLLCSRETLPVSALSSAPASGLVLSTSKTGGDHQSPFSGAGSPFCLCHPAGDLFWGLLCQAHTIPVIVPLVKKTKTINQGDTKAVPTSPAHKVSLPHPPTASGHHGLSHPPREWPFLKFFHLSLSRTVGGRWSWEHRQRSLFPTFHPHRS